MKYTAGLLKVVCASMVILMPSLDARAAAKKRATGAPCRLKALANLTKTEVETSLKNFESANGGDLGIWHNGFPELQVQENSSLNGSEVQCSLLFMSEALSVVLQDQTSLNPEDHSLHTELRATISRVKLLTVCVKKVLGGECPPQPSPLPPPTSPPNSDFEKKQWSHTLLTSAKDYLVWLENKIEVLLSKAKGKKKRKHSGANVKLKAYFEGSGYLL